MDSLGIQSVPFLARRNYYHELQHMFFWSILAGLLEGQFAAVVVAKTFHGNETMIAVATATPTAANLFSVVWGLLCVGRPKIRLALGFALGAILCAAGVFAVPATPAGAVWFLLQVSGAQVFLAGVITVRSAIWKSNYPSSDRGRITARLQGVRFVMSVLTALVAARLADRDPHSYAYVYPAAAVCGTISVILLARVRIRGERRELRRRNSIASNDSGDRAGAGTDTESRLLEPHSLAALLSPGHVLGQMVRVLRNDRRYCKYCLAQMCTGLSHLMTVSIVVAVVTRDLVPGDAHGYWTCMILLDALPKLVMLGSLGRWGRVFDRMGVLGMRTLNMLCWTTSIAFGMAGDLFTVDPFATGPTLFLLGMTFFALRAFATGLGQGGGAVAWYIGHLHFARPEDAEVYMGIHVSLTGFRGLVAPLAGMWLWRSIGWPVWVIALAFSLTSFYLFTAMAREEKRSREKQVPKAPM
jgi:hypothetical protein